MLEIRMLPLLYSYTYVRLVYSMVMRSSVPHVAISNHLFKTADDAGASLFCWTIWSGSGACYDML